MKDKFTMARRCGVPECQIADGDMRRVGNVVIGCGRWTNYTTVKNRWVKKNAAGVSGLVFLDTTHNYK